MENSGVKEKGRGRPDALRMLLIAGLSIQAWGVVMGLGLIILNMMP